MSGSSQMNTVRSMAPAASTAANWRSTRASTDCSDRSRRRHRWSLYSVITLSIGGSVWSQACLLVFTVFQLGVRGAVRLENESMNCGAGSAGLRAVQTKCTGIRCLWRHRTEPQSRWVQAIGDRCAWCKWQWRQEKEKKCNRVD